MTDERQPGLAAATGTGEDGMPELRPAPLRPLVYTLLLIEGFLLPLMAVAPLGGVSQAISPLARVWPWLLLPARAVFGSARVTEHVSPEQGWPALALFALVLVGASCVAALPLPLCHRSPHAGKVHLMLALGGAALLGLTLVLLPSLPSGDVFSYIVYGRISVVYHANPLVTTPAAFPKDPFLPLVFWRGVRSVYGPAWLLLSGGITALAQLAGGGLAVYVLLFKLLGLGAHLANVALIWGILGRLAPRRQLAGTLFYAWNPLCLLEFCASAHNDAVMLTFALLGVYWLAREREAPAMVAFGLSIATKYVLLALLPFYLALVVRRGLARGVQPAYIALAVAWRLVLVVATVVISMLPFWAGPATFGAILFSPPAQQLDNSLMESLSWPLRALAQAAGLSRPAAASGVETALKIAGLAGFAAIWALQFRRVRDLNSMLQAWGWALWGYVVIASGWFWPWYVTWLVVVVALLPWGELAIATLLLAGGVLTLYAFLPLFAAPVYGARAWLAFGPAAGYLLWRWRKSAAVPQPQRGERRRRVLAALWR